MNASPERSILITGGTGGLGLGAVQILHEQGWRCILADQHPLKGDDSPDHPFYLVDVTSADSVAQLLEQVEADHGFPDALLCLAGVVFDAPLVGIKDRKLQTYSEVNWRRTLDVNLTGTFLSVRAFTERAIRLRRKPVVITCSSPAAVGAPGQCAYAASKAGVEAFTVAVAHELAPWGIRVCGFRPPLTLTPMAKQYSESILNNLSRNSLAGRIFEPVEVAETIRFLLDSPAAHGRIFSIDGGISL